MTSRARISRMAFTAALLALLAFAVSSASAKQTHLFQETFGSAFQPLFSSARGITRDPSTGDLLVIDQNTETVSRFNPDGTPDNFAALGTNVIDAKGGPDQTPQNGLNFGSFSSEQQVAIDDSGTITNGNIYVTQGLEGGGHVLDVFAFSGEYLGQLTGAGASSFSTVLSPCGVAVDGDGNLFVAGGFQNKVYKFDPSANPPLNTDLTATYSGDKPICNLAAGAGPSAGSLFANTFFTFEGNSVLKFSGSSLALQSVVDPGEERLVSVDPATGHLYAVTQGGVVSEFDGANLVSTFAAQGGAGGLAAAPGEVFFLGANAGATVDVYGPRVTVPDVTTGPASITGDTSARLSGTVNPDGVTLEECGFEYGLTTAYGQVIPCAESVGEIGTSSKAVHADLSGLSAESLYHFRLTAKNANAKVDGSDQTLKTPSKPGIQAQWATDVGLSEAILKATISPENSNTTYRFEWGSDTTYGQVTGEIAIGSGTTPQSVSKSLAELQPGSTYHWRVVATNSIGVSEGADHVFITYPPSAQSKTDCPNQQFRTGVSAKLPDCRAYEMVSPVDKNGGDVAAGQMKEYGILPEVSADGERATFSSLRPFGNAQSAPLISQYFADRGPSGWSTRAIDPPRDNIPFQVPVSDSGQFKAFGEDLCSGWFLQESDLALVPEAPPGVPSLYRSDNCGEGSYELLTSVVPPGFGAGQTEAGFYVPNMQGFSTDESHTVFRAPAKLTSNACTLPEIQAVYVTTREGPLRLVSVLPNGQAACTHSSAGVKLGTPDTLRDSSVHHAVSADGSRVFWTASSSSQPISESNGTGGRGPGKLYVRLNATQAQSKIVAGKCSEPEKACTQLISESSGTEYWDADAAGTRAIYTVGDKLFEYDVEEAKSQLIAEGVKGLAGSSEDASRVYFISTKALSGSQENGAGAKAQAGRPNLYLSEGGTFTYLGTLGSVEAESSYERARPSSPVAFRPYVRTSRVSPDGLHLAFTSNQPLTGYDNADAVSGEPDTEVFLYDASPGAGAGQLTCVSCNPSGARPNGKGITVEGTPEVPWAAATLPAWTQQLRPSRLLSDDGSHLFFNAIDALVPRDTNGRQDVYEWQRASGPSECAEAGAELFVASAGGCLSLISSGQSGLYSEVIDASKDAADVLFATSSSLLPQDPGLVDIYDARVGGGYPSPPTPQPSCEGEACQGPLAPPNDPTPGSSSFEGAGNVVQKPAKKKAHKKKHAKKKAHKSKQANHKRRAGR